MVVSVVAAVDMVDSIPCVEVTGEPILGDELFFSFVLEMFLALQYLYPLLTLGELRLSAADIANVCGKPTLTYFGARLLNIVNVV